MDHRRIPRQAFSAAPPHGPSIRRVRSAYVGTEHQRLADLLNWLRRRSVIVGLICVALVIGFVAYVIWDLGQPNNVIGL